MEKNVPKYSSTTLEVRPNYYVVAQNGSYHYYPLRLVEGTATLPIIKMQTRPPVVMEGQAFVGRVLYSVTLKELLRGIIRQSSKVETGSESNGKQRRTPSPKQHASSEPRAAEHPIQSGAGLPTWVELSPIADAAWEEQKRSLLETLHQEEGGEWVIESFA